MIADLGLSKVRSRGHNPKRNLTLLAPLEGERWAIMGNDLTVTPCLSCLWHQTGTKAPTFLWGTAAWSAPEPASCEADVYSFCILLNEVGHSLESLMYCLSFVSCPSPITGTIKGAIRPVIQYTCPFISVFAWWKIVTVFIQVFPSLRLCLCQRMWLWACGFLKLYAYHDDSDTTSISANQSVVSQ